MPGPEAMIHYRLEEDHGYLLRTFNRCQLQAKTLDRDVAQMLPELVEWGILVQGQNSRETSLVRSRAFASTPLDVSGICLEPQSGKSGAFNAGIQTTQGNVLAFIDDDVAVELTCCRI
jgi:hypothetical protein